MPAAEMFGWTVGWAGDRHGDWKSTQKRQSDDFSFGEQIQAIDGNAKVKDREEEIEIAVEEETREIGKYEWYQ